MRKLIYQQAIAPMRKRNSLNGALHNPLVEGRYTYALRLLTRGEAIRTRAKLGLGHWPIHRLHEGKWRGVCAALG